MRPWSKVSNAVARNSREARIADGRPASEGEALMDIAYLHNCGSLQTMGFSTLARSLGWSRGKLSRVLGRWRAAGELYHEGDEQQAERNPLIRKQQANSNDAATKGIVDPSRTDGEQQPNSNRTADGPSRASPLREKDRDTEGDPLSAEADGVLPSALLDRLNLVRRDVHGSLGGSTRHLRGLTLTPKRRTALARCIREVHAMKLDEPLLQVFATAARWMYESTNIRASGSRQTGEPIDTLLRTSCVEYVELALQEAETGIAPPVDDAEHTRRRFQLMVSDWAKEEPTHG